MRRGAMRLYLKAVFWKGVPSPMTGFNPARPVSEAPLAGARGRLLATRLHARTPGGELPDGSPISQQGWDIGDKAVQADGGSEGAGIKPCCLASDPEEVT